ncbi:hypothetical protein P154DRAFT_155320 [Amniculicola lignicola CBS 123094]|uniref:Uncharacterized protein n=1 Tax=Amniculicola lignicola CBS 123094 TaxID=1392246 RepID=A0A6A5WMD4_9PLEO|nr:hypothetical protein P154DRAFT_155320 [Amniculicola lignicola CBS 123094]
MDPNDFLSTFSSMSRERVSLFVSPSDDQINRNRGSNYLAEFLNTQNIPLASAPIQPATFIQDTPLPLMPEKCDIFLALVAGHPHLVTISMLLRHARCGLMSKPACYAAIRFQIGPHDTLLNMALMDLFEIQSPTQQFPMIDVGPPALGDFFEVPLPTPQIPAIRLGAPVPQLQPQQEDRQEASPQESSNLEGSNQDGVDQGDQAQDDAKHSNSNHKKEHPYPAPPTSTAATPWGANTYPGVELASIKSVDTPISHPKRTPRHPSRRHPQKVDQSQTQSHHATNNSEASKPRRRGGGPFVHSICGARFWSRDNVRSHHHGQQGRKGCKERSGNPNISW